MSTLKQKVLSGELNPIIYLPMVDSATAHQNLGYGGDFTQNGVLDTASVGATWACKASYFDGSADYLSRTSLTGIADGKVFTFSCSFKGVATSNGVIFSIDNNSTIQGLQVASGLDTQTTSIIGRDDSNSIILYLTVSNTLFNLIDGVYKTISICVDMDSQQNTKILIDGSNVTYTTVTFIAGGILNLNIGATIANRQDLITYFKGNIGELYFDTKYIDLATNNPFWDSVENKPKPVRQVIRETGITPLIAMPLDASNAGKNYGTGGDFTANSAPYVGARGGSEVWQRTAKFDGSTSYLSRAGLTGITDTKTITLVGYVYKTASTLYHLVGSTNSNVSISINASNQLVITAKNTAGTTILSATVTTAIANTTWTSILLSIDLSNTANRSVYLNGVLASVTWTTYANDNIDFTNASWVVGADIALGNKYNGTLAIMLDNTYIDFTSEVNRLKYIDGLSYPLSINEQVVKGIITKPALYIAFEDTSNLGLNSGYGGNLTVNGTVTQGADVNG